jgi:exonuclease III
MSEVRKSSFYEGKEAERMRNNRFSCGRLGDPWLTKRPNNDPFIQLGLEGDKDEVGDFNSEGRLITAEYEKFFVVTTYVPNAGAKLITLPKRMKWDPLFR